MGSRPSTTRSGNPRPSRKRHRKPSTISGEPQLLKIDQVAMRLRVSVGCIRAWRLRGDGPPAIRIGTALRWDAAEVEAWLDSRRESRLDG
ncbi:helix-turn-helix transcriptional regulator [Mycolicibacterium doricum]|uniref:helix-turn-helix transcriptional regulator n=2 Tax=Mycolicibacterium doricum TaxID=126673 RepID=UPI000A14F933